MRWRELSQGTLGGGPVAVSYGWLRLEFGCGEIFFIDVTMLAPADDADDRGGSGLELVLRLESLLF
jgi:hypothetical protein